MSAAGPVTLNFLDADIREVISAVLGDALGLNYAIDPQIQGTLTIRTTRPLPPDAVLPLLEDLLASNGIALVRSAGAIKAVPMESAAAGLAHPQTPAGGFGLHAFPLRFASAPALLEILEPFVPTGRVLRVDASRNLLLFAGSSIEAAAMQDLIALFDVDWMQDKSFALLPVNYANPRSLASELEVVFGQDGVAPPASLVRFVPIDRMRAILAITSQPLFLSEVEAWVGRLDRGEESDGQRVYVYRVQNGRALELAQVLSEVFGTEPPEGALPAAVAPGLRAAQIASQPAGASRDLTGSRADGLGPLAQGGIGAISSAQAAPATASAERAETAAAIETVAPAVNVATAATGGTADSEVRQELSGLRIVPDERSNSLFVLATPSQYRLVVEALEQVDIMPLQVLIEATVAEVTLNDELRYGVEWFFQSGSSSVSFSSLPTGAVASAFPGFSYLLSKQDIQIVVNALARLTEVRVVSSPQLVVLDNGTARLQVGDEVPVATQTAVSVSDADAPLVSTIEFRSTGVILEVTPRVNAGGLITLDLTQEVSRAVPTTTSGLESPTIQQRLIQTSVAVQSGEAVALGGLIRDGNDRGTTGVPLLSDIPILGNLFKTTRNNVDRTELLVLMAPRIIRDINQARQVTKELRQRLYMLDPPETLND